MENLPTECSVICGLFPNHPVCLSDNFSFTAFKCEANMTEMTMSLKQSVGCGKPF